jgi:type I restriction enzyme, R subunit
MTGSASDPLDWQPHIRNKPRREALAKRFRDPRPLPARDRARHVAHRLRRPEPAHDVRRQADARPRPDAGHRRVNRVFKDKPGGLVVDYLGLAHELKKALATYTESGGTGRTALDQDEAVAVMLEKYEVCCGLFHGFDWSQWTTGTPQERLSLLPPAQEHILARRTARSAAPAVRELSQAFALAVPHDEALRIRDDVAFFQAVQAVLAKARPGERGRRRSSTMPCARSSPGPWPGRRGRHLRRGRAREAGHLDPVGRVPGRGARHAAAQPGRGAAAEAAEGGDRTRGRKNVVQARSFAEMLEQTLRATRTAPSRRRR